MASRNEGRLERWHPHWCMTVQNTSSRVVREKTQPLSPSWTDSKNQLRRGGMHSECPSGKGAVVLKRAPKGQDVPWGQKWVSLRVLKLSEVQRRKDCQWEHVCDILTPSLNRKVNRGVNYRQEKKTKTKPQTNKEKKDTERKDFSVLGTWDQHKSLFLDSSPMPCWWTAGILCPGVRSSGPRLPLPPAACDVILGRFI